MDTLNFAPLVPQLNSFKRIVIKIGSSLLVDRQKQALRHAWLKSVVDDLQPHIARGADILIVSSGAIALGRTLLKFPKGALTLEQSQAAASVGQIELARVWSEVLREKGVIAGQILVTLSDTEERRRYLNARNTIETLLSARAIPVVNENDTVATSEIRYGDNDRLAARVASMVGADCLVLLSDIDGLYTAPPHLDASAKLLPLIVRITAEIEAMAGGAASEFSRGGMMTKIEAGKIATSSGCAMVIASGLRDNPLRFIEQGGVCSWFLASTTPQSARKNWISGTLEPRGILFLDAGAVKALARGKSLLPAGVIRIEGEFSRGDAVVLRSPKGDEIGRGLVAYDSLDAHKIMGKNSAEIASLLGFVGRAELIHRDDMSLV